MEFCCKNMKDNIDIFVHGVGKNFQNQNEIDGLMNLNN